MIPPHFIDELLSRLDVVDVIGARIELKKGAPTEILVLKNTLEING